MTANDFVRRHCGIPYILYITGFCSCTTGIPYILYITLPVGCFDADDGKFILARALTSECKSYALQNDKQREYKFAAPPLKQGAVYRKCQDLAKNRLGNSHGDLEPVPAPVGKNEKMFEKGVRRARPFHQRR